MTGNSFFDTAIYYVTGILLLSISLIVFEMVTRYNNWEEIRKGNVAVAMAIGGKIFGLANIMRYTIQHQDTLGGLLIWGGYGFLLLLIAYWLFEFLTLSINVDEEIGKDNRAVGLLSMMISIALSFIIGASIA